MNPLSTFVVFTAINSTFVLTWATFEWIASLITKPGLFMLVIASIVCLARFAALLLAYPGHLRIVTRDCERNFAKMCKRWLTVTTDTADQLVDFLQSPEVLTPSRLGALISLRDEYRSCVESIVEVLRRSLEIVDSEETLSIDGQLLLSRVRVFLKYSEALNTPLRQFISRGRTIGPPPPSFLEPPLSTTILEFKSCIQDLRDAIDLCGEQASTPKRQGIVRLICELWQSRWPFQIVANLSLMRADLIVRYHGRQVWVESADGHAIDGMFIPGLGLSHENNTGRTVLLCNPNCGLYEFHHFQSDWIQFYTKFGINVFVFNYRGYGRCKGYPSPHANNMDGMAIIEHLKSRGITRIAVHGESIGGMVATHVARHAGPVVELLIADRTFANLPAVAQRLVASWAGSALSLVTRWQTDNVSNYLDAPCNKLVCCDPSDEIIADASSLKAGIALRLELGDMTLGSPTESESTSLLAPCASPHSVQRQTESTEIVPGMPLNEAIVTRFATALQSIGERASLTMVSSAGGVEIGIGERHIVDIWTAAVSIDGYCGQTLYYATGGSLEGIRTWIASFLVWGPTLSQSQASSQNDKGAIAKHTELVTPLPIDNVVIALRRILTEAPDVQNDEDVAYVLQVVEYLKASLDARLRSTPTPAIGQLVPLSCGHNANFSEHEKQVLVRHLVSFNWIDPSQVK
ncbi:hypothetical protein AC1031_007219 [Aphanomyces cochlioides]|nr:hypothetical protein AC1031_007219 [Aphanomyces cochlioides]